MTQTRWDPSGFDDEQTRPDRPIPTMVSLHFLRSALRRRWLVCVLAALLGLLAAATFLAASPVSHPAMATLVLAHDAEADPSLAMATDVSLLRTRTVAAKTITSLGLTMTPDEFLKSVTAAPVSSELLALTLTAPSDAEAVRRLTAFTSIYLDFRAEQLSMQSNVLVSGMQERIKKMQSDIAGLSRRIDQLAGAGDSSASGLSDTIAQRAYVQGQIETLQQSVEDATLQHTSVVSSSRVIDPAATDAAGLKRRIALALASGLIGGLALGCGIVLFFAIISDRLRRRSDVAAALEVPVPVSVGKIAPIPKRWLWLPHLRAVDGRRTDERQRLARAIELELPVPGRRGRLAVACIDNADEVRFAFAAAAADLAAGGRSIALIDLTEHGSLDGEVARLNAGSTDSTTAPTVFRPRGIPALAGDAADLRALGQKDGSPPQLERNDVTLVLADLDPSVGAHHLKAWTDRVIVPVTAGRSSAERVTTAADLVRTAGLEMRVAVLLRTERTDNSSGVSGFNQPAAAHLGDGHEQPLLEFEKQVDTGLVAEIMTVTAAAAVTPEPDDDRTEEELEAESGLSITEKQAPAGKQTADDEQATVEDQAAADEQQAEAVLHADGNVADAEQLVEAKVDAGDEQQPEDEIAEKDEQEPMAEVADAEAEQQADTEVSLEVEPEPEAEVAEEQQTEAQQIAELLAQGALQADAEVAETEEQVEAEVTDAELAGAEVAEGEQQPEAAMAAEGKQQSEAHAAEEQPEAEEPIAQGVEQVGAEVAQTEELIDREVSAEVEPQPEADVGEEPEVEEQQTQEKEGDPEVAETDEQVEAEMTAEGKPQVEAEVADAKQQPGDDVTDAEQQADAEEQQADDQQSLGDHQTTEKELATSDEEAVSAQPANAEQKPDAEHAPEADASAEPDQVPDGPEGEEGPQSWNLYLVKYPPVHVGSAPGPGGNGLDSDHDSAVNDAQGEAEHDNEPRLVPVVTEEVDGRAAAKEPAGDGQVSNGQSATRTRRRPRRRRRKVQDPSSSRA